MKIRSLLLGSIAAAGLASGAQAADLGVLTSLDVCDALGISGLTISSDTNCLQISGKVSYEFAWGDYRGRNGDLMVAGRVPAGEQDTYGNGTIDLITAGDNGIANQEMDWQSNVTAWLTAVATADSDFGPAKAVITLKQETVPRFRNENYHDNDGDNGGNIELEEAYVAVGDSTVIMAGRRADATAGSVVNFGDDGAFNFLGSFAANKVDGGGVLMEGDDNRFGHDSIQIVSDLGNGFSVAAGLENITGEEIDGRIPGSLVGGNANYGTLVGVVQYAGEGITAHVTGGAFGVLDGDINEWFVHAGATGTFDAFKIRAAAAYSDRSARAAAGNFAAVTDASAFHGLVTGQATFDMFTIALTGEYARAEVAGRVNDGYGIGGSVGAKVTDGVAINLGARYFNGGYQGNVLPAAGGNGNLANAGAGVPFNTEDDLLQVAIQVVASLSETITVTGEIGGYWNDKRNSFDAAAQKNVFNDGLYYGALEAKWVPGGGFETSLKGEANTQGAYRLTYKASKSFE